MLVCGTRTHVGRSKTLLFDSAQAAQDCPAGGLPKTIADARVTEDRKAGGHRETSMSEAGGAKTTQTSRQYDDTMSEIGPSPLGSFGADEIEALGYCADKCSGPWIEYPALSLFRSAVAIPAVSSHCRRCCTCRSATESCEARSSARETSIRSAGGRMVPDTAEIRTSACMYPNSRELYTEASEKPRAGIASPVRVRTHPFEKLRQHKKVPPMLIMTPPLVQCSPSPHTVGRHAIC